VQLAENLQDPVLLVGGHFLLGDPLVWIGEFVSARRHLERAATFYDRRQHQAHIRLFGHDLGIMNAGYHAVNLWYLGYPDQALQVAQEALAIGSELSHAFSLNWSLIQFTVICQLRREWQHVQEKAEEILRRCSEYGFLQDEALPTAMRGWALAMQGGTEEGIAELHKGMATWRQRGAWQGWTWFSSMLADAYRAGERPKEGLQVVDEAFDMVRRTGEHAAEAELYRLKGELSLQLRAQGSVFSVEEEAESCFRQALAIVRKQNARSWELRASVSLARLWQQQRKETEAQQLLSPIYHWFSEGFETADVQEAKALLNELR
jgi:predicted ATPase